MTTPSQKTTQAGLQHLLRPATKNKYEKVVLRLVRSAEKMRGATEDFAPEVTPSELAEDLLEAVREKSARNRTLAERRSSLIWYFSSNGEFYEYQKALAMIVNLQIGPEGPPENGKPLRREPARNIPERDLKKLITYLEEHPGYEKETSKTGRPALWGVRALAYIQATVSTGLRPNEWIDARWSNELRTHLIVKSSKLRLLPPNWRSYEKPSDGAGFIKPKLNLNAAWVTGAYHPDGQLNLEPVDDDYETVLSKKPMTDLELALLRAWRRHSLMHQHREVPIKPENITLVERHMSLRQEFVLYKTTQAIPKLNEEDASKLYYTLARNTIYDACIAAFQDGRTYSLYDLRSKFSSNTKAEYGRQAAVEALGHNNSRTIGKSYGHISDADKSSKAFGKNRRKTERERLGLPERTIPTSNGS